MQKMSLIEKIDKGRYLFFTKTVLVLLLRYEIDDQRKLDVPENFLILFLLHPSFLDPLHNF